MRAALAASRSAVFALGRGLSVPGWTMAVVAISLAAWLGALALMAGADARSGAPLHDLPVFLVGWVVMLTAMMLPSELSYIGAFAALLKARRRGSVGTARLIACFVAGYGIAWVGYGLAAFVLNLAVQLAGPAVMAGDRTGPLLAGSVLIIACLYQVSSLKNVCLIGCRTPLSFFARHWRAGAFGAVVMGARHGLVCVGCCWAMMAVMFAVGAMSLTWMALLTVFMFAEKVLPQGRALTVPIAGFFCVMGIWVAASPETAPLLKYPMMFGAGICRAF